MMKRTSLIIVYAVALHFVWALSLYFDPSAVNITAMGVFPHVMEHNFLPVMFFSVATAALLGLIFERFCSVLGLLVLLLPQQAVLFLSASAAIGAVMCGCFADGVERSH